MANPTPLPSDDDYEGPYLQANNVSCEVCGQEWGAIYPAVCQFLECPACSHMNPAPFLINRQFDGFFVVIAPAWCTRNDQLAHSVFLTAELWQS